MKKKVTRIVGIVMVFFLTFSSGVYANELYQEWIGSQDYRDTSKNLNFFQTTINNLFDENERLESGNASLEEQIDTLTSEKEILSTDNASLTQENAKLTQEKDSLTQERNELKSKLDNVNLIYTEAKTQLTQLINDTNNSNGKGNRYDVLSAKTNELAGYMEIEERINGNVGNGSKSNELEQAEIDMNNLKEKSDNLVEEINSRE